MTIKTTVANRYNTVKTTVTNWSKGGKVFANGITG